MGDLGRDTGVRDADGVYEATLSREWETLGPMGGYVVATALRAAARTRAFGVPRASSRTTSASPRSARSR